MSESKDPNDPGPERSPDESSEAHPAPDAQVESTDETISEATDGPSNSGEGSVAESSASPSTPDTAPEEPPPSPPAQPSVKRTGRGVAWFAVLIAAAGLGLASRPYWAPFESPSVPDDPRVEALKSASDALQLKSEALQSELEALRSEQSALQSQLDPLQAELDALQREVSGSTRPQDAMDMLRARLEPRIASLEQAVGEPDPALARFESRIERIAGETNTTVEALRARIAEAEGGIEARLVRFEQGLDGLEGDVRQTAERLSERLRLLRIEALLATGADRLLLFGDRAGAERAWQAALEQVESFGGSRFQALRAQLAEDLGQLRAVEQNDESAGRAATLLSAARTVDDWPLAGDDAPASGADGEVVQTDENGWRQRLGGLMDRLVVVERTDEAFLDPAERDRARERAEALLESVALMLLRGESRRAGRLAEALERHIRDQFVVGNAAVAQVLENLELPSPDAAVVLDPAPVLREVRRLAEALR